MTCPELLAFVDNRTQSKTKVLWFMDSSFIARCIDMLTLIFTLHYLVYYSFTLYIQQ